MDKKFLIYGTPLSKSLQAEDDSGNDGPISSRRARFDRLQTVRDEQGRQRFHGAFTGGFSAGYYNTVDSVEGFQPRNFVSSRGSSSRFSHKPEDYMDDEDLGEFGIAPKKVRVNERYSSLKGFSRQHLKYPAIPVKNDFHGLGYKTLNAPQSKTVISSNKLEPINPLMAILSGGKRLKISGEAFGLGVLDEDGDCVKTSEAYGYDDLTNYDFNKSKSQPAPRAKSNRQQENNPNTKLLDGFTLASNLEAMQLRDNFKVDYPQPNIPNDWTPPRRKEPYIPPFIPSSETNRLNLLTDRTSGLFHKKFTDPLDKNKPSEIETKAGLLCYTDLKVVESDLLKKAPSIDADTTQVSVSRQELEWRPCSLLCKHFNVPNPFPDNQFVGLRPTKSTMAQQRIDSTCLHSTQPPTGVSETATYLEPAPLELKRTIFNVIFEEPEEVCDNDDEEEPQVIEVKDSEGDYSLTMSGGMQAIGKGAYIRENRGGESSDPDEDIMIVAAPKLEPEVIVLGSSSSSSSSSASSPDHSTGGSGSGSTRPVADDDDDIETYGPPLPPTMRTLHKHLTSSRRRRRKKRRR